MAPFYDYEIQPGAEAQTDTQLDEFIRNEAESAYHPCVTCRLGSESDPLAVVGPDCKVIGTENLFCADSSSIPPYHQWQSECTIYYDRRKSSRSYSGSDQIAICQLQSVYPPSLADTTALKVDEQMQII